MNDSLSIKTDNNAINIGKSYRNAQALMQGIFTNNVAFNTTIIPHWVEGSDCFWYEREYKSGREFRLVDANLLSNELAFDHRLFAEILGNTTGKVINGKNLPIKNVEIRLSPFELFFDVFGKRWKFDSGENSCSEIHSFPSQWLLSPDGKKAAFTRDYNIWIVDLENYQERQLTFDGEPFFSYASTPSTWGVNMIEDGLEAVWSPDSKSLFTLQLDTRGVKTLPMTQYVPKDGSLRPITIGHNRRMALPGDNHIDEYRFLALDVFTGRQQEAFYRRCPVFRNAMGFFTYHHGWWSEDSRHSYFIDLERGGDHVARLVEFDTHTGATRIVLQEESPDTCFKLCLDSLFPICVMPLPNSNDLIWYSERSGWAHLYLYDIKTGVLKHPITQGDWMVRDIHHFDPERRELVIQTSGRVKQYNAYYRDIVRVNVDTGEIKTILSSDHEYVLVDENNELAYCLKITRDTRGSSGVCPSGKFLVTTRSRVDEVPVSLLVDRDGRELLTLETADVTGLPEGWQWPEPVKLTGADGHTDIYGVVYRPSGFSPDKSYPILDVSWVHKEGCPIPAGSFTNNNTGGMWFFASAALAELGFVVVDIYGRGTSCRDRKFSADPNPHLPLSNNQSDRVAAIYQLSSRYPYMDIKRVGAGGNVSTNVAISSLLGSPELYKVGITNGAISDQRLKSAFYGEAYGDLASSTNDSDLVHTFAERLSGKLLLMHGMLHPTVSVADPFRLIDALQRANKNFDMLFLPNDGYGTSSYAMRRGWDYLVQNLLGVEPPHEFELKTSMDLIMEKVAKEAAATAN